MVHSIWRRMIGEQLHPKLVDLAATGSSYAIDVGPHSLSLSFGGFKDNIPAMMQMVTQEINNGVDISKIDRFNRIVESLKEELLEKSEMPVQYAIQDRSIMLLQGTHSDEELVGALGRITPPMLLKPPIAGIENSSSQLTSLTMGNVEEKTALAEAQKFKSMMKFDLTLPHASVQLVTPVVHPK